MTTLKDNYQDGDVAYGRSSARKIYLKEKWLDPEYEQKDVFEESEREKFERTNSEGAFKPLIDFDVYQRLVKQKQPFESLKEEEIVAKQVKYLTIDELNNHEVFKDIFERDAEYKDYKDILDTTEYEEIDQQDNTPHGIRHYWKKLIESKFSPERLPKLADEDAKLEWDALVSKYPEIGHLSTKLNKSGIKSDRLKLQYLALRRACKFGIAYMTGNGQRVHFVLDGINMWDVAEKRLVDLPGAENPGVSITTSELRYVYRNWSELKDRVFFYMRNAEVVPPWEWDVVIPFPGMTSGSKAELPTVKSMWEMYGQRRLLKQSKDLVKQ